MKTGQYRPFRETPFKWRYAGGTIVIRENKLHVADWVYFEKLIKEFDWIVFSLG